MTECEIFSLSSLMENLGDEDISEILSKFHILYDGDVQTFLREKAIIQEKKQISKIYLIFDMNIRKLVAYFSIAISIDATGIECSNNVRKKLNVSNDEIIQSYLIGQVGRDSKSEPGIGKWALKKAMDLIPEVNSIIGCRAVRVDCKDDKKLVNYYTEEGFTVLNKNKNGLNRMVKIIP